MLKFLTKFKLVLFLIFIALIGGGFFFYFNSSAGPTTIAQFDPEVLDVQDNRENEAELYQFKVELPKQIIEIGNKESGLPSYKITDEEGYFVEWKLNYRETDAKQDPPSPKASEGRSTKLTRNSISYDLGNLEVKYEISPAGVKPYYILKEKPATNNFILNFALDFSPELELVKSPAPGAITAYTLLDKDGRTVFEIKSPDAIDAAGEKTFPNLLILQTEEAHSTSSGQAKKAFIFLDSDFLANAVYPIVIDPTTISSGALAGATQSSTARKFFRDSNGNLIALYIDSSNNGKVSYCNDTCTTAGNWTTDADNFAAGDVTLIAGALDSAGYLHIAYQDNQAQGKYSVKYGWGQLSYSGNNISGVTFSSALTIDGGGNNDLKQLPSIIILHDGKPAIVWNRNVGGGTKDTYVYFLRCTSAVANCDDATTNWYDVAGTSNNPDAVFLDGTLGYNTAQSLAQMPGSGTAAKDLYLFWSKSGGFALKYNGATCATNCEDAPAGTPTWSDWTVGEQNKDASTVSADRFTYINTLADATNERIVVSWASSTASEYAQTSWFINKDGGTSASLKIISSNATETNVDAQPSLSLFATTTPNDYLVFLKNSSGNLVKRTIEAPGSTATDWVGGSSWSAPTTIDSGTANTWPQAVTTDSNNNWDIIYMSAANTLSYESDTEVNYLPSLTVSQPDGVGDTVVVGDSYDITYTLTDAEDAAVVDFYYHSDTVGTTTIAGCQDQAEGTGATCAWDTTGIAADSYYVYGSSTDSVNPDVIDYSPGQITIQAVTISITRTDGLGTINYGTVSAGGSTSTNPGGSGELTTTFQNNGNVAEKFSVNTGTSADWESTTTDPSSLTDIFRHSFTTSTIDIYWKPMGTYSTYATASSSVAVLGSLDTWLQIELPGTDTSSAQQTITVTVQAEEAWACGDNVTFTYRGAEVTYGTVSSEGECWMDRNLGATSTAAAYNDADGYGDLFQWGRLDDDHQDRNSGIRTDLSTSDTPTTSDFIYGMGSPFDWRSPQNNNLWQGVSGTNNPCPSGWRIPTETEWETERVSWTGGNNYDGAYASPLKLTAGGGRIYSDASLSNVDNYGYYWSSTVSTSNARYLYFYSTGASMTASGRAYGFSVRCVQD